MNSSHIASTRNGLFAIVLSCLLATFACAGGGSGNGGGGTKLSSIKVSAANANPTVGDTVQLTATGKYGDGSTTDLTSSVTWSASPAGLASVSAGGVLTATAAGAVSVTAAMGGISGSASVTIAPKLVSIAITPASKTIAASTKWQFVATGTYSDNSTQVITGSVSWSSSNAGVATISDTTPTKGLALGVGAGSTNITASSGSITSNTAVLTVTSANATSLVVSGPTNMALDVSQQFTATATFSDGTTQDVTNVSTWSSGSTSIATVTVSGLVTAKNLGTTNISASFESVSDSSSLTVDASNLTSIEITAADKRTFIAQGTKIPITATGHFNNGSTSSLTTIVNWSSSDTSVAQFGSVNQLSGLKPGNITITATLGSVTASLPFEITNATIQSITVTPVNQTIAIGWHQQFTATGKFSDSSNQDISTSVTWSSDNSPVAQFGAPGSSIGVLLGVTHGNANVSASFSFAGVTKTGSTPITVSSATLSSISVVASKTNAVLAPGATMPFNAKGKWSDGSTQNVNVYATWSSSDTSVATVGISGVATGQSSGTVMITAKIGTISNSASLIVEGSNLISIKITPQSLKLPATIETQLTATGTFGDGQTLDLTSAVTWTSSTPSVATVSNSADSAGIATGVATGTSTVSASFAGISATTPLTITVTTATLTSIAVTPSNPSISLGSSQLFVAQGTFTDSSVVNITVQVAWTSSDVTVATIKSNGLASSASTGTTIIKASLNGVNGTTILTVH
ncbi:MAG TPA: Ig-like domain-containing protein [Terriglobales bacterium]|nr:Ig-like domain-containing protein [Terriglobales bacterium]